jgi:hypothetical protein
MPLANDVGETIEWTTSAAAGSTAILLGGWGFLYSKHVGLSAARGSPGEELNGWRSARRVGGNVPLRRRSR